MSTRAQIAIQIGPDEWAHVYVHFDGYPAHMLPALECWKPDDILAAEKSGRSRPRHWIASARLVIRASCRVRRGNFPISACGLAASGCRWCRKSRRAVQRQECNQKTLILLVFAYTRRPARAMVITRKRCNSPPETTP